MKGYLYLDAQC